MEHIRESTSEALTILADKVLPKGDLERVRKIGELELVQSAEEEARAVDDLAFVQACGRAVEKARKELVDPLNRKVRETNARFKDLKTPIEAAERRVKAGIRDWRQRERERIDAERKRVEEENERRRKEEADREEAEKKEVASNVERQALDAGYSKEDARELAALEAGDVAPAAPVEEEAPAPVATTTTTELGSATSRMVWKYEVVEEAKVPRAYCRVDSRKIADAVRSGIRDIPGVRIFEEEVIAGRRGR